MKHSNINLSLYPKLSDGYQIIFTKQTSFYDINSNNKKYCQHNNYDCHKICKPKQIRYDHIHLVSIVLYTIWVCGKYLTPWPVPYKCSKLSHSCYVHHHITYTVHFKCLIPSPNVTAGNALCELYGIYLLSMTWYV